MSLLAARLLRELAGAEARAPAALAEALGVDAAELARSAQRLADWGLPIEREAQAWRLPRRVELLDPVDLRRRIGGRAALAACDVLVETDSTNARLLAAAPPPLGSVAVCSAEFQTAGRGRRGRRWAMPLGAGLCMSVASQFAPPSPDFGALTLAVGVAARRALVAAAGVRVALKWPNDLVWDGRKLGGILVETAATPGGGRLVVAGIGVNVALPPELAGGSTDWEAAVDLAAAVRGAPPARAAVAAELIVEFAHVFRHYAVGGFEPYRAEWQEADLLVGRPVMLDEDGARSTARAVAVAADGALIVETDAGVRRRLLSGDVTVRSA